MPNIAYTRYVLDVGLNGDFLDLICALVPCPLGYGQVGHNFAKVSIDQENIYHSWIKNYSDNVYQESCHRFGKLLDKSIRERLGPRPEETPHWEKITENFCSSDTVRNKLLEYVRIIYFFFINLIVYINM